MIVDQSQLITIYLIVRYKK